MKLKSIKTQRIKDVEWPGDEQPSPVRIIRERDWQSQRKLLREAVELLGACRTLRAIAGNPSENIDKWLRRACGDE